MMARTRGARHQVPQGRERRRQRREAARLREEEQREYTPLNDPLTLNISPPPPLFSEIERLPSVGFSTSVGTGSHAYRDLDNPNVRRTTTTTHTTVDYGREIERRQAALSRQREAGESSAASLAERYEDPSNQSPAQIDFSFGEEEESPAQQVQSPAQQVQSPAQQAEADVQATENAAYLEQVLARLRENDNQRNANRNLHAITHTNTITTVYKDGRRPSVRRTSTRTSGGNNPRGRGRGRGQS